MTSELVNGRPVVTPNPPAPTNTSATTVPKTSSSSTVTPFVEASAEVTSFDDWKTLVQERFPGWAWALDHDELGPLLQTAAEGEFTPDTFNAQLKATTWYTSRTEAQRAWDVFATDPANDAEQQDRVTNQVGILKDLAGTLGVSITDDLFNLLAEQVLRNNMSEDEVIGELLSTNTSELTFGSFTAAEAAVRQTADQWLVNTSPEVARDFATKLLNGEMNQDGVTEYFKELSRQRFPSLESQIDRGVNLQQLFDPHRNQLAQMLGIAPASIDMVNDPRFMPILSIGDGGETRHMTVAEVGTYGRTLDDYWTTPGGQGEQEKFGFLDTLSKTMGVRR